MSWLHSIAERKIQAAIDRGELDDSPLKGKPLLLETNPFVPEELQMAYKLLKDAGYIPPEMELRKEIVRLKDLLGRVNEESERARLARDINDLVLRLNVQWKRSLSTEERQVYVKKLRGKIEAAGSD